MKHLNIVLAALLGFAALSAQADVTNAEKLAKKYTNIAKTVDPTFVASVEAGKDFYTREIKHNTKLEGKAVACASCHTANPADKGRHIVTGKTIKPLSPIVNTKRFTNLDHVEEKFTKHCTEVLGSDCSAAEKANYITYLLTEKTPTVKK
ncbi:MAG: DUF1924 domain-containing protein [Methylotenera sp.]|nr:DUF1924 domain-containing protein [Methylotenera sp.]